MKKFLCWIRNLTASAKKEDDRMITLLKKLALTEVQEISCDDVHAVLAEFAERKQQGEAIAHLMPQVAHHLELCPACREEYEALLLAIEAENKLA
jgi:uncharacterized protein YggL (DUF469 family)